MHKTMTAVALASLLGAGGLALAASDAAKQIETARQHADFAAKVTTAQQTQQHLHHVVNCLVGPNGDGFDASAGNPCKGMGNGAINDIKAAPERKALLEQAAAIAKVGTGIERPAPAVTTAQLVRELIEHAQQTN